MGATHQGEDGTQQGWKQRAQPLSTCLRPQEKPLTSFEIGEIWLSALFKCQRSLFIGNNVLHGNTSAAEVCMLCVHFD